MVLEGRQVGAALLTMDPWVARCDKERAMLRSQLQAPAPTPTPTPMPTAGDGDASTPAATKD